VIRVHHPHLVATYDLDGQSHRIELIPRASGRMLLVDRPRQGPTRLIAELERDEGTRQARAILHQGAYLRRAQAGEPGLAPALDDDQPAQQPLAGAA